MKEILYGFCMQQFLRKSSSKIYWSLKVSKYIIYRKQNVSFAIFLFYVVSYSVYRILRENTKSFWKLSSWKISNTFVKEITSHRLEENDIYLSKNQTNYRYMHSLPSSPFFK